MTGVVLGLAAVTMMLKGAASLLPRIPDTVAARLVGLAPALLAALVMTELTDPSGLPRLDEKAAGVAAAVVLAWRRAPFAICVAAGAATAALLRAL